MQTRAAVVREYNQLTIETIELDSPQATEVLVRVRAAGVCHSDLHTLRGELRATPPLVLGHEGAGIVERVGERVGKTRLELASIGCDYELLLSIPAQKFALAKKLVEKTGCVLTQIGVFAKEKKVVLKTNGGVKKLLARSGFQHAF